MSISASVAREDEPATRNALWATRLRSKLLLERAKAVHARASARLWSPSADAAFEAALRRSRWHLTGRPLPRVIRRRES